MGEYTQDNHELETRRLTDVERQGNGQLTTPSSTTASDRSTAFLDGLRGLAAFCVFIQHYMGSFSMNVHEHGFGENGHYYFASMPFVRVFYNGGSAAVSIFFVLSGYVLSKSPVRLLRNGKQQTCAKALASAVVRRPFRLYLPCFGITLIIALMMRLPFDIMPEVPWCKRQDSFLAQLTHWFIETLKFFNPFQSHGSDHAWYPYDLVIWTIPIELKGSMLIYFLTGVYGFSGISQKWSLIVAGISVPLLLQLGEWSAACFISGLILSVVDLHALDVSFLSRHFSLRQQVLITHGLFVVGWYLLSQPAVAGKPQWSLDTPGWHYLSLYTPKVYNAGQYYRFWQSYGAILVVYCALRLSWMQKFLNTRSMRYLGKVSFMFYLIHLPYLYAFGDRLGRVFGHTPMGSPQKWWDNIVWVPDWGAIGFNVRFLVLVAVQVSIILMLSEAATRMLDTPSVRMGKKLAQRLGLDQDSSARKDSPLQNGRLPETSLRSAVPE